MSEEVDQEEDREKGLLETAAEVAIGVDLGGLLAAAMGFAPIGILVLAVVGAIAAYRFF